jgi:GNAT superfamily N-acetyltransferase
MLQAVPVDRYEGVLGLATSPHLALVINSVVAGNSIGQIWANSADEPRTAMFWDRGHVLMLLGEPSAGCAETFARDIMPAFRDVRPPILKASSTEGPWERHVAAILAGLSVSPPRARQFLAWNGVDAPAAGPAVPDGYRLLPIDQSLLSGNWEGLPLVLWEIQSTWASVDHFLRDGFGICAVTGGEIAGWCTAEYVSKRHCGIGIETAEAHQQKGIGTAMALAFVDEARKRSLTPHWDSWTANTPSLAVARKAGFVLREEYTAWIVEPAGV